MEIDTVSLLEQNNFLDICMDPNEAWFIKQRDKLADRLNQHAQDLRDDVYDTPEKRQELSKLLDCDRLDLLSLLLSHNVTGSTGWVVNLECCGPSRIDVISNQLHTFQEGLNEGSSSMLDLHLRLIATQIGRLRLETFIVDEQANRMDGEAAIVSQHILAFEHSDPIFKSWESMEAPYEACFCDRCKK